MPTGLNLIQAIKRKETLMAIGDCPGVPARMGKDRLQDYLIFCFQNTQSFKGFWKQFRSSYFVTIPKAFYGEWQSDEDETILATGKKCLENIRSIIEFSGGATKTAVWHFDIVGTTHHFVVMPWIKPSKELVYTVFMAYEHKETSKSYTLNKYINGTAPAPNRGVKGYKDSWNSNQLRTMLNKLLNMDNLWGEYFGAVGPGKEIVQIS